MLRHLMLLLFGLALTACGKQYLVATNFNDMLYTGMSRTEFDVQWHNPTLSAVRGNLNVKTRRFLIDGDSWEVLSYSVYDQKTVDSENPAISHKEYVAFRNGYLEHSGRGELPDALQHKQELH